MADITCDVCQQSRPLREFMRRTCDACEDAVSAVRVEDHADREADNAALRAEVERLRGEVADEKARRDAAEQKAEDVEEAEATIAELCAMLGEPGCPVEICDAPAAIEWLWSRVREAEAERESLRLDLAWATRRAEVLWLDLRFADAKAPSLAMPAARPSGWTPEE